MDGLDVWDEALKQLNLTHMWNKKKINIQWIKRKFASGAVYLISPILIVGIKSIHYTQGDAICVLQDPTGRYNQLTTLNKVEYHIAYECC